MVAAEPVVELLWEAGDPHEVLRDRFGLASPQAVVRWLTTVLEEHWGVRVEGCGRVVMSDANALAWLATGRGPLVAKWCVAPERFARLAGVARLTAWLGERGLPVSAPVPSGAGRLQVEVDGVSIGVQRVVDGHLLDVDDPTQVRAAGAVLARAHLALADHPDADGVLPSLPRPEPLADRVTVWADRPGPAPAATRDAVRRELALAPAGELATQLVHGDFRAANVLCDGPAVVAVLDLEEVRLDHPVVELARSAVLLGTRFRDWGPVAPEVHATLRTGYESVRPLDQAEARCWPALVRWQAWSMVPAGPDPTGWARAALDLGGPGPPAPAV